MPSTSSSSTTTTTTTTNEVLKKEEEALITLMKERALVKCKSAQRQYYECVKGRMISVVWACRERATAMSACLSDHTSEKVLEDMKARWVSAGKPSIADRNAVPKF